MKILTRLIYTLFLLGISNVLFAHQVQLKETTIAPGAGYSADEQQVAPQYCYNMTASQLSGDEAHISLNEAIKFSDLENELNFNIDASGGYGMFSASAEASYFHYVEDKNYSLSLNYYDYAEAQETLQAAGVGPGPGPGPKSALNTFGQQAYDNGQNPRFGLLCGDYYINSYEVGALLTMSLNIQFQSHYEKTEFESKASGSWGNIISAAAQIQQISTQYKLTGSVSLNAYQRGGDPSQLAKILSRDPSGDFYILTCDLQHMDNCVKAANGLLNYANSDFPTQFSFTDNKGLTPLGLGFATYKPISYLKLTAPASFVTPQVSKERMDLAIAYKASDYYLQELYSIFTGYPVAWDATSPFYQNLTNLQAVAQSNRVVLAGPPGDPDRGALACYDFPDSCDTTYQNIEQNLKPITANDLQFLAALEYWYQDKFGNYFYYGNDNLWGFTPNPMDQDHITGVIYSHYEDPNNISYEISTTGATSSWQYTFQNGVVQPDGQTVTIQYKRNDGGFVPTIIYRCKSPYFFSLYSTSKTAAQLQYEPCMSF